MDEAPGQIAWGEFAALTQAGGQTGDAARGSVRRPVVATAASVLIHVCVLAIAAWLVVPHPPVLPALRTIDVELLPTIPVTTPSPSSIPSPPPVFGTPALPGLPPQPQPPATTTPKPKASPATVPPDPLATLTTAKTLYSAALLLEPASREVRETLPTLDRYERITQLCNIETTEQIRRALPKSNPETVSASAFAETNIKDGVFLAPGAAYRSHRKWYYLSYSCVVRGDLSGVEKFAWRTGAAVPKDLWESHDLIGVDEDDE